jgi:hypothetical protein
MESSAYSKVSVEEDEGHNNDVDVAAIELTGLFRTGRRRTSDDGMEIGEGEFENEDCDDGAPGEDYDEEVDDDDRPVGNGTRRKQLPGGGNIHYDEVDGGAAGGHCQLPLDTLEEQLLWNVWNRWEEPCILSIFVTVCPLIPALVLWMYGAFAFVNRFWAILPFAVHGQLRLAVSMWYIKCSSIAGFKGRRVLRVTCSAMTILEIFLCGVVYPTVGSVVRQAFFRDVDGTLVDDWVQESHFLRLVVLLGWLVVLLRCCVGGTCLTIRVLKVCFPSSYREWRPTFWIPFGGDDASLDNTTRNRLHRTFRATNLLMVGVNGVCALSAASHFGPWPMYSLPKDCDDLDETECALPFPSFHHMRADSTSPTGWRVHLRGLPPLRGGLPFHPRFLNELDGFSTSKSR